VNEGISSSLILKRIRHFSKKVRQKLIETKVKDALSNIEILEIDELFSGIKLLTS